MKKDGFTLLEVILAIFILVTSVAILSNLNVRSFMRLWQTQSKVERTFILKKDLLNIYLKLPKKDKIVQNIEKPETKIISEVLGIDKKSELKNFIDKIKLIKSEATWNSGVVSSELKMFSLALPEKKKKS